MSHAVARGVGDDVSRDETTFVHTAASQVAMLALTGVSVGDLCWRSDDLHYWQLVATGAADLSHWSLLTGSADLRPVDVSANIAGGALEIDFAATPSAAVTAAADLAITLANPSAAGVYRLVITQDGTGGHTVTLPTLPWALGIAGTCSTAANANDILTAWWSGSAWIVAQLINAVAEPA